MAVGTPDGAKQDSVDPVLQSALSDMQSEGLNTDDPFPASSQDESSTAQPVATPDPGDGGAADPVVSPRVDPSTPADPTTTPATEDPYAGSEPFTFPVDGQLRTMEGVYRFPGEGLLVPEAQVPQFQLIASRAETLERANREMYQQRQDLERLTTWKTQGPDGKEATLTGRDALEAQRVLLGRHAASLDAVLKIFHESPLALLATDEQGNLTWNKDGVANLITRTELAELNAEKIVRAQFHSLATAPAPTPDLAASAPQLVAATAKHHNVSNLTDDDTKLLTSMVTRFVRPATPEEVRDNPSLRLGEPVIDPAFAELVKHQGSLRTNASHVQKVTDTATTFNTGMKQGLKPKPTVIPQKPAASPTPPSARQGRQAVWDDLLTTAVQELAS